MTNEDLEWCLTTIQLLDKRLSTLEAEYADLSLKVDALNKKTRTPMDDVMDKIPSAESREDSPQLKKLKGDDPF